MHNDSVSIAWDDDGYLTSITDLERRRELLPAGRRAAVLELAPDHPVEYDAWDLEQWTHRLADEITTPARITVVERGPLVGAVQVSRAFGRSRVTQTYRLRAGSPRLDVAIAVDWHEDEKVLTLDVPLAVRTDSARCEIQFGHVSRPTHANTSWDAAKFEVPAHRWVDLAEPNFGVAVLNDGRYGYAVGDGGIRVTLQRAPVYPAPDADRGHHEVTISVLPHGPGLHDVLHEAECLNLPLIVTQGNAAAATDGPRGPEPVVQIDHPGVLVSAVKRADDDSGDVVVRLWEAAGDRCRVIGTFAGPVVAAHATNLLEDLDGTAVALPTSGATVAIDLEPFQMATVRVRTA